MNTILHCAVMLVVVLLGVPGDAAERLVPYDDFNATQINPDKWFGSEYSPAFPSASTEAIRQLQDARLYLRYRSYGPTDADGGRLRSELALLFRTPAAVTAIQAVVQVTDVVATECPGSPERTAASANLGGRFFGTAPSTPDGDVTDTVAFIGMFRGSGSAAPPDELRARSLVFQCANRPCTAGSELHRQDLGPVKRGERVRLRVQWDRDQHRFIFQRDDAPEVLAPYAVAGTAPPGIAAKVLNAMHFVPNCPATPRPMAFIEAWFDDVMVNESAAPRAER
jgi:hypothetical protein